MWINRLKREKLQAIAKSRPAILLTGARQTGKSSLLKNVFNEHSYITFDDPNLVESAISSPEYFLEKQEGNTILDEVQYVPSLFRELKISIDKNREQYGKWILTGSQQFSLMKNTGDSLAGRLSIMHLETLSAKELRDSQVINSKDYLWKGGYPELWSNPHLDIDDFFQSYIKSYIEKDLTEILKVSDLRLFRKFIKVIALRVGQLINFTSISKEIGVSDHTIRSWTSALQVSGLIYLLPPFFANIGKRLTKSPKVYFADHGLLCYLLGIESMDDWYASNHRGNIWKNIVFMELIKNNNLKVGENIFFYRDQNKVEVDFIIEKKNILYLIEAKSAQRIDKSKLNFSKVAPLFSSNYNVKKVLAQNITSSESISSELTIYNPVLHDLTI